MPFEYFWEIAVNSTTPDHFRAAPDIQNGNEFAQEATGPSKTEEIDRIICRIDSVRLSAIVTVLSY